VTRDKLSVAMGNHPVHPGTARRLDWSCHGESWYIAPVSGRYRYLEYRVDNGRAKTL
jgi:hypothetical protein